MEIVTEILKSIGISYDQYLRIIYSKKKSIDLPGISVYYDNKISNNQYIEHICYRKRRHQENWDCISILLREENWKDSILKIDAILARNNLEVHPEIIYFLSEEERTESIWVSDSIRIDYTLCYSHQTVELLVFNSVNS